MKREIYLAIRSVEIELGLKQRQIRLLRMAQAVVEEMKGRGLLAERTPIEPEGRAIW